MSRGLAWTITLWPTASAAEQSKAAVDDEGCGDGCYGDHQIARMDEAVLA